jgi:hypothetical protein
MFQAGQTSERWTNMGFTVHFIDTPISTDKLNLEMYGDIDFKGDISETEKEHFYNNIYALEHMIKKSSPGIIADSYAYLTKPLESYKTKSLVTTPVTLMRESGPLCYCITPISAKEMRIDLALRPLYRNFDYYIKKYAQSFGSAEGNFLSYINSVTIEEGIDNA